MVNSKQEASKMVNGKMYPVAIRLDLARMSPLAQEIADRWMLGWEEKVKQLLSSGQYLERIKEQEQAERRVLSDPENDHLSSWEKLEVAGVPMSP